MIFGRSGRIETFTIALTVPLAEQDSTTERQPAILQIIPHLNGGGAERTTVEIAAALVEKGYRALIVSEGGRLEAELGAIGAMLIRLPVASKNPLTIWSNIGRMEKLIRAYKVALVHARSRAPAWSALYATRKAAIPLVTTHHGIYNAKSAWKRHYNSVMVRGDAVIANSQWTADHIAANYSPGPKRMEIIPRGLDLEVFDPQTILPDHVAALRALWGVSKDMRIVLLPARLTRWKGHLVLIDALARLKREDRLPDNLRLVFAGDAKDHDDYVDELVSAISEAGLTERVVFAGHISEMRIAYMAADLVVSASTDPEAFGRVVIEAAAMTRPVIATDHGGTLETVLAGKSGYLVPPNDAAALAEALATALAQPKRKLTQMGRRGRTHVGEHFSLARMCNDTLALYADLLNPAPKS